MLLTPHLGVWALALSLISSSPAVSLTQSPQSSDEEAVRALTERYGQAISAGDLDKVRQLWKPESPDLASRLRFYQALFSNSRIEFISLKATTHEVTGEKAVSHLTTDERRVDKVTGSAVTDRDVFHGACRSLEWIKTGAGWKIERESLLQDDLATRLEALTSEDERRDLLSREKALVTDVLVRSLIQRGDRSRTRGDSDAASRCFRLAQTVAEKIGDESGIAMSWLYLGLVKVQQNDPEAALPFEQRALALYEAGENKLGTAIVLYSLSHIYHDLGDYRQALECANRSLRLSEGLHYRLGMASALIELSHVYNYQNNYQQALAFQERALAIYQELGEKIQIAIARYAIVKYHQELGNYDRALELYQELLKQTEGFGDPVGAAIIRGAIGSIHVAQGRYAEARDYYRQSLQGSEGANYKFGAASALVSLAGICLAEGKYAEALPLAEQALPIARQVAEKITLYSALTSLGYCQLGLNHTAEARHAFSEAISIIEESRANAVGGAEERQRDFEDVLDAYRGMLKLHVKENQTSEALVLAERTKARVLLDVLQQGRVNIQKAMTVTEREQESRLKSEMTRLNTQLTRATQSGRPDDPRIREIKPQLEKARLDYEAFQISLYAAHPDLKVHRGEAPIINAEELTALLPDATTALLEYVVTDDRSYLFAITKAPGKATVDAQVYTLPMKRAELSKQTEAFRQQLAGRDLGFRSPAVKLYDLLLKPAQAQLKGKTNLIIVPDDKLWELPFQALLVSEHRFLIEDTAISYAPSLTVLREVTRRRHNQHTQSALTLLAVGNPTVGKQTVERATLALRDEKLTPLPEAEQEVKALGQLYGLPRSKVYVGPEAREDRVKAEAGQAGILHFATHGTLNNASPMYSHLVLAQGNLNEDGLLEGWELMQMDLKAELAVLSACETARGRFGAGEGIIGLTWAMFVAGVPATVVSQWKVEAASTRDLMVSFHRGLNLQPAGKAKATKAEALRQAALKLMRNPETSHPFYWAGFVLVGDGR